MAFRFDKLTVKAQEAVARAQELAGERGQPQIDALHLLAALLGESEGIVRPILDKIGANRGQLDGMVQSEIGRLVKSSSGATPQPDPGLKQVLDAAAKRA